MSQKSRLEDDVDHDWNLESGDEVASSQKAVFNQHRKNSNSYNIDQLNSHRPGSRAVK
jgi:hypothetical protein